MKVTKKTRSLVLTLAHAMQKRNPSMSFGDGQRQGWKVLRQVDLMKNGVTSFTFKKINGEIRQAVGKLDYSLDKLIMQGKDKKPLANIRYFDLTKDSNGKEKGWRSFRAELML